MFPKIIYPLEHTDPHINITNRQYNWFTQGRSLMPIKYSNYYFMALILYYPSILLGKLIMSKFSAFKLERPLFIWNMFMSLASGYLFYLLYPLMVDSLKWTEEDRYCQHGLIYASKYAWIIALFNATKICEWIDTIFLILRKRKIIFLHWFHHLLTFTYCWHATFYSYRSNNSGLYFCGMNLFVHAIMYFYYALAVIKIKLPFSFLITFLQTSQMFIGIYVNLKTINCADTWRENWHGLILAGIMYFIYLILFSQLLINKLCKTKKE